MKIVFNPLTGSFDYIVTEHDAVTVADTSTIDLTLTGQQVSGVVLPGGVDHDQLLNFASNEHFADAPADGSNYGRKNNAWEAISAGGLSGSGTNGQVAKWTGASSLGDAALIPPATNILTLTNAAASTLALNITSAKTLTLTCADNYTLTIPATGTAALLGTANVFTAAQKINVNSTTALLVEQDGVKDNVLVVDTTNGYVGLGVDPENTLHVNGSQGDTAADIPIYLVRNTNETNDPVTSMIGLAKTPNNMINGFGIRYLFATQDATFGGKTNYIAAFGAVREDDDRDGMLIFQTTLVGTLATRMVLTRGGRLGVGTTSPAASFDVTGTLNRVHGIFKGYSTQTSNILELQDSSSSIHTKFSNPGASSAYETVFNEQGSQYLDFRVESDTYDALFVDASNNSVMVMSNTAGKVGFYGTTAVAQQVLATGAGKTVDEVITFLQTIGLCKQS